MAEARVNSRRGWKQLTSALLGCVGAVIFFMVTLGFIPNNWLCDICSQLRLVYACTLLVCSALLILLRSYKWAGFVLIGFAINALPISILASDDICILDREAGPAINSDHLPVYVKAAFAK